MKGLITPHAPVSFDDLRAEVQGRAHRPGDEGFDALRSAWNLTIEHRPLVVVTAERVEDVQAAVRFATQNRLPIAVQTTGHGQARHCTGGLLLRMERMNDVRVDAEARTATVAGGAKWSDVIEPAFEAGLAPLSGSAPHVGVVGYTLGGGFGLMVRKYGLAVDSVRSMQVVTADGALRTVSQEENADLFWAMLGGGGAFGIVTRMEIELYPHPMVYGGAVIYPAELADTAFAAYAEWTSQLPDDVTSSIGLMNVPPLPFVPEPLRGRSVVLVTGCVTADEAAGGELMAPMRTLGEPIMDRFGMLPFTMSGLIHNDPVDPVPGTGRGVLLDKLNADGFAKLLEAIGPMAECPNLKVEIRHLGGAAARAGHAATSIGSRRRAEYLIYVLGLVHPGASPSAMEEHAERVFAAVQPWTICRGPLNFLGEGNVAGEAIRGVYDEADLDRLQQAKRAYDPENVLAYAGIGVVMSARQE